MIFVHLILKCLHDFFIIVVLLSYIGLSLRQTTTIKVSHYWGCVMILIKAVMCQIIHLKMAIMVLVINF